MSEVSVDATVIKRTQDILGNYVKKPVLSEKLLKKPPFRFLHDVFNAVIRSTGCFQGLYTPEELNFENISDRDAKMKFLQKMIDAIKITTNEHLTVKTSKIVAGHDPEKTNELLQLIGIVIEKKLDWKTAVETVNNGGVVPSPVKSEEKVANETKKKTKEKPSSIKKIENVKDNPKIDIKEKTKAREIKNKPPKKSSKPAGADKKEEKRTKSKPSKEPLKKTSPDKVKQSAVDRPELEPEPNTEPKPKSDETKNIKAEVIVEKEEVEKKSVPTEYKIEVTSEIGSPSNQYRKDERRASKRAEEILLTAAAEDTNGPDSRRSSGSKRTSAKSRKSSAEKARRPDDLKAEMTAEPTESLKTVTEEPLRNALHQTSQESTQISDVRRESTFVRENSKEASQNPVRPRTSLRPPSARPASARPGAPRRRDKNVEIILQPNDQIELSGINVKLETFTSELEDDGENLVIIENPNIEDPLQESAVNDRRIREDETLQQGHLVQQILETQKELVQGGAPDSNQKHDKDNDMVNMSSRQSSARQMNSLRDVIQNLTKSVNPLGKLMDFIPEDIDAMQLELTMWRDTYNQSSVELKKERSLTESVTEPMKNQLVTIEVTIKEYREMIDECRAKILQNTDKIHRLLTTQ